MVTLRELEGEARERLDPARYDFFAGGACDEITVRKNETAFARVHLFPRVLRGCNTQELNVALLGYPASMPIFIAPTAFHRLAHPDGERGTARAAADPHLWFQVYITTQLYARALDRAEATPIAGTEGGEKPFFSPDGTWIGFRAANTIKKVPAAGGASAVVCDLSPGMRGPGGSWGEDDAIYFSGNEGIFKVSAAGGPPVRVAEPVRSKGERLLLPHVLPGGNAILFTTVIGDLWDGARIVVQPTSARRRARRGAI